MVGWVTRAASACRLRTTNGATGRLLMVGRAASSGPPPCWIGEAAGGWRAYEWQLSNHTGCPPLRRYVHAALSSCGKKEASTVPGAGPSNLKTCAVKDRELLARDLTNASVLLVGDSTSAQLLWHACEAYDRRPASFVKVDARALNVSLKGFSHRLRSLDNHACSLASNLILASFSHYGATGPPYWVFAYPLAPWLANTTIGMVRRDIPKVREMIHGADPTVVVASSGFWDIAAWWAHEGSFSRRFIVNATHTAHYVAGVRRLVRELRRAFPQSAVVWRLMHPGMKHSITPAVVARLNAGVRAAAPAWRLPLIDAEKMVQSLSRANQPNLGKGPPYGTNDGRHLHPFINLALLNLILNIASQRSHGSSLMYGWRQGTGSGAFHTRHNSSRLKLGYEMARLRHERNFSGGLRGTQCAGFALCGSE